MTRSLSSGVLMRKEMLGFIARYQQHHGYSPSLKEIAANFNRGVNTTWRHLRLMERSGSIRVNRHAPRGITIVDPSVSLLEARSNNRVLQLRDEVAALKETQQRLLHLLNATRRVLGVLPKMEQSEAEGQAKILAEMIEREVGGKV